MSFLECPPLGFGVGLRPHFFSETLSASKDKISWVEAISENFMAWDDNKPRRYTNELEQIRALFPVALHGTSLSIGSADSLDVSYLRRLNALIKQIEPCWVSDHLCWTGLHGVTSHDLLPLPYTEEAIRVVVDKLEQVQEFLGRRILIENVSSYLAYEHSEMPEWEFLTEVARRADCGILLDINNIYVSSLNHAFNPLDYLLSVPPGRVGQMHLAGHSNEGNFAIDTHDEPVCDAVWDLYRVAARRFGNVSTLIEWDDNFPPWESLLEEVNKARKVWVEENANAFTGNSPTKISFRSEKQSL